MVCKLSLAIALALGAVPALAQSSIKEACSSYVGKILQPGTFDAAAVRLAGIPKIKGEFETEAQFAQRQRATAPPPDRPLIIATMLDREYVRYDADAGVLNIGRYAIDNFSADYDETFGYGTPFDGKVAYEHDGNIDVLVGQREIATGSYVGANAFGVRTRVTKIKRVTNIVFDRAAKKGEDQLFATKGDELIASLRLDVAQAQALKRKLRAAIVAYPKWPYLASGVHDWGEATIDTPEEVIERINVLVADIQCGLLLDPAGKVLAAFGR